MRNYNVKVYTESNKQTTTLKVSAKNKEDARNKVLNIREVTAPVLRTKKTFIDRFGKLRKFGKVIRYRTAKETKIDLPGFRHRITDVQPC